MKVPRVAKSCVAMAAVTLACMGSTAQAMQLMYVEGIPGDSQLDDYLGWIVLESVQASVGDRDCSSVEVTKRQDSATLGLIAAAATGELYKDIVIVNVEAPGEKGEGETFRMRLVPAKIDSISLSGSEGPFEETVVLQAGSLIFSTDLQPKEETVFCGKVK